MRKYSITIMVWAMAAMLLSGCSSMPDAVSSYPQDTEYGYWNNAGRKAGAQAFALMKHNSITPQKGNLIVLTNAGYAEIRGSSTMGFIDGLADAT
ncbi:MAG: hypothetical protein HC887_06525, partial [Desulfobacteraceae bacterium]|nr:hypothetical protein [Desulfobacteraceae bacterium]